MSRCCPYQIKKIGRQSARDGITRISYWHGIGRVLVVFAKRERFKDTQIQLNWHLLEEEEVQQKDPNLIYETMPTSRLKTVTALQRKKEKQKR